MSDALKYFFVPCEDGSFDIRHGCKNQFRRFAVLSKSDPVGAQSMVSAMNQKFASYTISLGTDKGGSFYVYARSCRNSQDIRFLKEKTWSKVKPSLFTSRREAFRSVEAAPLIHNFD